MAEIAQPLHDKWLERAEMVRQFVIANSRLPTPADGPVGAWLSGQRSAFHRGLAHVTDERQKALDSVADGWREFLPSPTMSWEQRLSQLVDFRSSIDRWPSQTATDPDEQSLANWLSMQRSKLHGGQLSASRKNSLDEEVSGWDPGSRHTMWLANAGALSEFMRSSGRRPSKDAENVEERRLGVWLHNRRQESRKPQWSADKRIHLNEVAPGWDE